MKRLDFMNVDFFSKEELTEKYQEFRREVLLMSGLTHPNLVSLKKIAVKPFAMLTEYIPCGDLYKYLQRLNASSGGTVGGKDLLSWNMRIKIAESKSYIWIHLSFFHSLLLSFNRFFWLLYLRYRNGNEFLAYYNSSSYSPRFEEPKRVGMSETKLRIINRNTIR